MRDSNGYPIRTEKGKMITFIEMYKEQPLVAKIFYPYLAWIVLVTTIEFF